MIRCSRKVAWISFTLALVLALALPAAAGSQTPRLANRSTEAPDPRSAPIPQLDRDCLESLDALIFRYEFVYFNFDSHRILPGALRALHRKVNWLRAHPEVQALIEGHCDERGTPNYNRALGQTRAEATRDYLVAQGIDPARIKIVSLGADRPQLSGQGDLIWYRNRRAEFLPE
jgi:peptidoglycan-associated lipoprotein